MPQHAEGCGRTRGVARTPRRRTNVSWLQMCQATGASAQRAQRGGRMRRRARGAAALLNFRGTAALPTRSAQRAPVDSVSFLNLCGCACSYSFNKSGAQPGVPLDLCTQIDWWSGQRAGLTSRGLQAERCAAVRGVSWASLSRCRLENSKCQLIFGGGCGRGSSSCCPWLLGAVASALWMVQTQ
jgi:hypothetical protein